VARESSGSCALASKGITGMSSTNEVNAESMYHCAIIVADRSTVVCLAAMERAA
jgi:hypothetical protein